MFYDRLKAECSKRKWDVTPFVTELGFSAGNLAKWKKGVIPSGAVLIEVANALGVSVDYLLGRTDNPLLDSGEIRMLDDAEARLIDELRAADGQRRDIVLTMAYSVLSTQPSQPFFAYNNGVISHHMPAQKSARRNAARAEVDAEDGSPITAAPECDEIFVPSKYFTDDYAIVRARGDSMIDADIHDGDYCVFHKGAPRDNGLIMLAQVYGLGDQPGIAIRWVYFKGREVELRPANSGYSSMFFSASDVALMGVLVAILNPGRADRP